MEIGGGALDAELEVGEAPEREEKGGHARAEHIRVGDHHRVARQ